MCFLGELANSQQGLKLTSLMMISVLKVMRQKYRRDTHTLAKGARSNGNGIVSIDKEGLSLFLASCVVIVPRRIPSPNKCEQNFRS